VSAGSPARQTGGCCAGDDDICGAQVAVAKRARPCGPHLSAKARGAPLQGRLRNDGAGAPAHAHGGVWVDIGTWAGPPRAVMMMRRRRAEQSREETKLLAVAGRGRSNKCVVRWQRCHC
jgi:hypothetical protein